MVGDTLETDIMGGNHFGIDTVLVLTGNTQAQTAKIEIESSGIIPDYICKSVSLFDYNGTCRHRFFTVEKWKKQVYSYRFFRIVL